MTDAAALPELYPRYCFHLSPTIGRFCHLRISDLVALTSHPGFRGQDIFFYINHPIKWVRIAGIVVAIDEFEGRRVYTVDDSSGATVECVANTPLPPKPNNSNASSEKNHPLPVVDGDVDVGHVIDVKGSIRLFRDTRQVQADKISHLRSTEQEAQFWDKLVKLREDILGRPWVLSSRELRRCRKEAEGHDLRRRTVLGKEKKGLPSRGVTSAAAPIPPVVDVDATARHRERKRERGVDHDRDRDRERDRDHRRTREKSVRIEVPTLPKPPKVRETGLERKPRSGGRVAPVTGKYDALGL